MQILAQLLLEIVLYHVESQFVNLLKPSDKFSIPWYICFYSVFTINLECSEYACASIISPGFPTCSS